MDKNQILLPIVKQIAVKSISNDLIFTSSDEIDKIKSRIDSTNRNNKINYILNDEVDFEELFIEDDEEYKKMIIKGITPMNKPNSTLFYLDFKYDADIK